MKTKIYLVLTLMVIGLGVEAQSVTISGKIPVDIPQVTLKAYNGNTLEYDEVIKVMTKDGKYRIDADYDAPNLFLLDFSGKKRVRLSLTTEKNLQVDWDGDKANVIGSKESLSMLSFERENGELQAKHFAQLKIDADAAMASGDKKAMQDIQDRSGKAIQAFLPELRQWIIDQGVGPAGYLAIEYSDFNKELDFIDSRLKEFEKEIPNSPVTKALALRVYRSKVLSIGKVPPAIDARDREGEIFSLEQYKGKVLLVDFWAAWCRACRIENPQFVKLHEQFNDEGFEVVSVSQDRKKEVWEEAIVKDGVGIWRHIWDQGEEITNLYGVSSLPQNVVIGRNGKIIGKNVNAEKLQELLSKNL